jgi:hypothetical protein
MCSVEHFTTDHAVSVYRSLEELHKNLAPSMRFAWIDGEDISRR